jgi:hypothetical protein
MLRKSLLTFLLLLTALCGFLMFKGIDRGWHLRFPGAHLWMLDSWGLSLTLARSVPLVPEPVSSFGLYFETSTLRGDWCNTSHLGFNFCWDSQIKAIRVPLWLVMLLLLALCFFVARKDRKVRGAFPVDPSHSGAGKT